LDKKDLQIFKTYPIIENLILILSYAQAESVIKSVKYIEKFDKRRKHKKIKNIVKF